MLGLYTPTDMKEIDMSKDRLFASIIRGLNKELGTNYTPSEVFDVGFMKEIEEKWIDIPLNLDARDASMRPITHFLYKKSLLTGQS